MHKLNSYSESYYQACFTLYKTLILGNNHEDMISIPKFFISPSKLKKPQLYNFGFTSSWLLPQITYLYILFSTDNEETVQHMTMSLNCDALFYRREKKIQHAHSPHTFPVWNHVQVEHFHLFYPSFVHPSTYLRPSFIQLKNSF